MKVRLQPEFQIRPLCVLISGVLHLSLVLASPFLDGLLNTGSHRRTIVSESEIRRHSVTLVYFAPRGAAAPITRREPAERRGTPAIADLARPSHDWLSRLAPALSAVPSPALLDPPRLLPYEAPSNLVASGMPKLRGAPFQPPTRTVRTTLTAGELDSAPVLEPAGSTALIAGWLPRLRGAPFQPPSQRRGNAADAGSAAELHGPPAISAGGTGTLIAGWTPRLRAAPFEPPSRGGGGGNRGSGGGQADAVQLVGPPALAAAGTATLITGWTPRLRGAPFEPPSRGTPGNGGGGALTAVQLEGPPNLATTGAQAGTVTLIAGGTPKLRGAPFQPPPVRSGRMGASTSTGFEPAPAVEGLSVPGRESALSLIANWSPRVPVAPASAGPARPGLMAMGDGAPASIRKVALGNQNIEVREFEDGSRQMIYPPDGDFEFVVVQSTPGDLIPEGDEWLTGRPVQTVYLWVGSSREWVMQYCIPGQQSAAARKSGMVISLAPLTKLDPPFLRLAFLPPSASESKRALFHAILTTDGTLRDLRCVTAGESAAELMQILASWRFRPAQRDGVPQEVEVLLLMPGPNGTNHS